MSYNNNGYNGYNGSQPGHQPYQPYQPSQSAYQARQPVSQGAYPPPAAYPQRDPSIAVPGAAAGPAPIYGEATPIDYSKLDKPQNIRVADAPSNYPDLWATITFVLAMIVFIVLAGLGISQVVDDISDASSRTNSTTTSPNPNTMILSKDLAAILGISVGLSLVFSTIYFLLLQRFAGKMIHTAFVLNIVLLAILAVVLFMNYGMEGIPPLICLVITVIIYWTSRFRIPFAKVMLKAVTSVTSKYPATLFAGFCSAILSCAFFVLWIFTLIGLINRFRNTSSDAALNVMIGYLVFFLFWTTQVISNVVHVTVSGLFATVYFMGVWNVQTDRVEVPVKNPTVAAAKRALTTSFGPICFGSLLIAILQALHAASKSAQNRNSNSNSGLCILFCCLGCIIGCIRDLLEYFNTYAFVQVAIYGKGYIDAGKATWELFKARGFAAVINDNIVGTVLSMGMFFAGVLMGGIGYLYGMGEGKDPMVSFFIALLSSVIAMALFTIMTTTISSGVTATFVCLAEDPATLAQNQPKLFGKLQATYPAINWGARTNVAA